jgi:DNA replication protein DnaC
MKEISTIMHSKINTIQSVVCSKCGGNEMVVLVKGKDGEEKKVRGCLDCENKKIEKEANEYFRERDLRRSREIFERYSMVSRDLRAASFGSYKPVDITQKEALKSSIEFVETFNEDASSLLFQGLYGLGKSHLAYTIAKEVNNKGFKVIFVNSPSMLDAFRNSYRNGKFTEPELMDMIYNTDLLILDDIGSEYVKQDSKGKETWAVDKLFQIINSRIGKVNIYTTNLTSIELKEKYGTHGGRILSRMLQGTRIIKMKGEDYRFDNPC